MPVFQYEALDSQGQEVKSQIEALSNKEAISKIRNMGYFPTKVRAKGASKKVAKKGGAVTKKRRGAGGKVKIKMVTQFSRQLSTLQDAGLPILRSLRILEEQQKPGTFKRVIGYVADDIEGGATLSEAMAGFPKAFDRLFVNMIAAGEAGGVLDIILERVADFMEKAQKLKGRVKSAMIYPIVVLSAAFLILLGLMIFVVPQFETVLTDMAGEDTPLPAITRGVLGAANWLTFHYGWAVMLGVPFGIIFTLRAIRQFKKGRHILDMIKLRMPIIGPLTGMTSITRWTRTLGTLIAAGVPILEAINVTRETAGNEVYGKMLGTVHDSIRQGDSFSNPLRQSKTVDSIVVNMVDVGEETGDLDKMLLKVSENYEEQVDVMVASMMSLLEPIMIIFLGAVVLIIVLAIFLPMIQIITTLSG